MEKVGKYPMHLSLRCKAKSKRSGSQCKAPAVRGWRVCRMHGAGGGSKTGTQANAYKHGGRTQETIRIRDNVRDLVNKSITLAKTIL